MKQDEEMSYRKELDEIKVKYNEKVSDMLIHIRNLDTELVEKGMLLNKIFRYVLCYWSPIFLRQK